MNGKYAHVELAEVGKGWPGHSLEEWLWISQSFPMIGPISSVRALIKVQQLQPKVDEQCQLIVTNFLVSSGDPSGTFDMM